MRAGMLALLAGAGMLGGCGAVGPVPGLARPEPRFDVQGFFTGRTEGDASLKVLWRQPQAVRVHGTGTLLVDGTLILDQVVERAGKPPARRQWRIRPTAKPGRYTGLLSDATDTVEGVVEGNQLRLRFPMKDGLHATQYLYMQPDGRTVRNRMTIRKLGLTVAVLDETIRKVD
jgi:hypothetical protein